MKMTVEFIAEYERNNRVATIFFRHNVFEVDFYENKELVGTVAYPDNSIHYVEDAAYNYVTEIMSNETVEKYKKTEIAA